MAVPARAGTSPLPQFGESDGGFALPGNLSHTFVLDSTPRAWRMRTDNRAVTFDDRLLGRVSQNLSPTWAISFFSGRRFLCLSVGGGGRRCLRGITHVVRGLIWSIRRRARSGSRNAWDCRARNMPTCRWRD